MSPITVIWSVAAGMSLTLGFVHWLVWLRNRHVWASLFFALMSVGAAAMGMIELAALKAETTAGFGEAVRWFHIPAWIVILSMVGFVRVYFRAGRLWLAWSIGILRTLTLALNFIFTPNINFKAITGLLRFPLLGEYVAVAQGIPNRWQAIAQLGLLLLIVFLMIAVSSSQAGEKKPRRAARSATMAAACRQRLIAVGSHSLPLNRMGSAWVWPSAEPLSRLTADAYGPNQIRRAAQYFNWNCP